MTTPPTCPLARDRAHHLVTTLTPAMPGVFPWVRHLSTEEVRAFTVELVAALSDAAAPELDVSACEVIAGWRATARIKADLDQYEAAVRPTTGDFGRPLS